MLVGAREALTVEGLKFSESVAPRRGLVGGAEAMNENRSATRGKKDREESRAGKAEQIPFSKTQLSLLRSHCWGKRQSFSVVDRYI